MSFKPISVEQGEGKPPAIFERCFDPTSSKAWRQKIQEKIRQFGIAIKLTSGYDFLLRKEHVEDGNIDIFSVDIVTAGQRHVFIVNDFMVEYQLYREI